MSVLRSFLFCPANHSRRLDKTLCVDTDAVIIDLEDSVARTEKPVARTSALAYLKQPRGRRKAYVRVNALQTPWSFADFNAVITEGLDGIVLPKAESAADVLIADHLIAGWEAERGLIPGSIDLMPIIETAKGVEALREILRSVGRVKRACFGSGDFTSDTNSPWTRDNALCLYARARLAVVSRAAEREPPIDTVWAQLDDDAGFISETEEARKLGFQGKLCIHPEQLETVNRIFSPDPLEIVAAQKLCAAFEAAEHGGIAAIVVDGAFVDYPVVRKAYHVLEIAKRIQDLPAQSDLEIETMASARGQQRRQ